MKDLSIAEESTYSRSGSTSFGNENLPKKCFSFSLSPSAFDRISEPEPHSATVISKFSTRKELLRPSSIVIKRECKNESQEYYVHHLANYPEHWEIAGIEKIVEYLESHSKVHFQNISSVGALNRIRQIKQKFKNVTCEIPAAHLYFNSDSVSTGDTRFKNAPPIRNRGNFNLLWDLLKLKGIDLITSQHVNIDPSHKPFNNFQQSLNGIASLGCSLQAVWTVLNIPITRKELLEHYIVRLAKWMSLHPAKVLEVDKERGSIEIGKFADLVVWDPWTRAKVTECKYQSPFVGQDLLGVIKHVYVKGKLVNDKEFLATGVN
jgi:dihydroorotase-like cyclic amidohydrolase